MFQLDGKSYPALDNHYRPRFSLPSLGLTYSGGIESCHGNKSKRYQQKESFPPWSQSSALLKHDISSSQNSSSLAFFRTVDFNLSRIQQKGIRRSNLCFRNMESILNQDFFNPLAATNDIAFVYSKICRNLFISAVFT